MSSNAPPENDPESPTQPSVDGGEVTDADAGQVTDVDAGQVTDVDAGRVADAEAPEATAATEAEANEPPEPPAPLPSADAGQPWSSLAFSRGSTAIAVSIFLGLALVVWIRLAFGDGWTREFLAQNQLDMPDRVVLLLQMAAGGVVAAFATGLVLFLRRRVPGTVERVHGTIWFLSPLILLPAIPVTLETQVWLGNHRAFLPIVLFGAVLAEFFVTQSLRHTPASIPTYFREALAPLGHFRFAPFVRRHGYLALIVTAGLAYGLFMTFYTIRWHHRLGTAIFDLGINNNLFAGGLHGKFNHSPIIFPEDPAKYVANHVKVGLYIFLPIYALFPKPETLLTIQSISLGLGAIPLFLFARRRIPEWTACLVALAYLSYYPMHGANFYEMKEPPTAAAFVLTTIWAMDSGRFKTGWVFFFLSLFMREDMPIPLTVVGVVLLLSGHRPRTGLVMLIVGASWFVFLRFKVMTDAGSWWFPNMYKGLWAEPDHGFRGVLKTLVSNPTFVLKNIFVEKKFWYLMHMMTPLVFLPARRWYLWAAFVPGAILTLLVTDYDPPIMFSFQYVMHWAPYLFVAAVLAVAAIAKEEIDGKHRATAAVVAMALASAALSYNYGAFSRRDRALESGYHKIRFSWDEEAEKTYRDVLALVAAIPADASVAATERVGAHLSGRVSFYTLRRGTHGAEYLVGRKSELRLDKTRDIVRTALVDGEYGVWKRFGDFAVLKLRADTKDNLALLEEWGLDDKKSKTSRLKKKETDEPEADVDEEETQAGGD